MNILVLKSRAKTVRLSVENFRKYMRERLDVTHIVTDSRPIYDAISDVGFHKDNFLYYSIGYGRPPIQVIYQIRTGDDLIPIHELEYNPDQE